MTFAVQHIPSWVQVDPPQPVTLSQCLTADAAKRLAQIKDSEK